MNSYNSKHSVNEFEVIANKVGVVSTSQREKYFSDKEIKPYDRKKMKSLSKEEKSK